MDSVHSMDLLLVMIIIIFLLGLATTLLGIVLLATRATSKELRTLSTQTTKLVQKGLAEEVAGLVGNASTLLDAVNQMTRTTAGIGVFLTVFGLILMAVACWLALQIL